MQDIQLSLNKQQRGDFFIASGDEKIAHMDIGIDKGNLTVYHTEVSESLQGQGIAKALLDHMVDYAREKELKVIALCPYVNTVFKRHPQLYGDIWQQSIH